jgi:hypothetical protein
MGLERGSEDGPGADGAAPRMVVGVLTDPDLPASIARRLPDRLPGVLSRRVSDEVDWVVEAVRDPFEVKAPDDDRLINKAKQRVRDTNWDLAVGLTDVPVRDGERVVLAEVSEPDRVALVSLPALGGLRIGRRAAEAIAAVVGRLVTDLPGRDGATPPRRTAGTAHAAALSTPGDDDVGVEIVATRGWGLPRLLAGMVRTNRPWQLVLGLSTALAGALTGSAFGILYSTIWQLGAALSPVRLTAVTLGAIGTLVLWLVVGHDLWERDPPGGRAAQATWLRNTSTVLTIAFGAVIFFLTLFVLNAVAAAVVIPPDYLASTVGRPVGWYSYLTVALMATVLGTVAGAVGSGLENDATVRRATYGYREQERWREVG